MTSTSRHAIAIRLFKLRLKEWLEFDGGFVTAAIGFMLACLGGLLYAVGRTERGLSLLTRVHRSACSAWATGCVERLLRSATARMRHRSSCARLGKVYDAFVDNQTPTAATSRFFADPARVLGPSLVVLKSPAPMNEACCSCATHTFILSLPSCSMSKQSLQILFRSRAELVRILRH